MNYIYDIVLNFHENYYCPYEWKTNDQIINIKKIPLIKIKAKDYQIIKNNKVKIDSNITSKIINQTLIYSKITKNKTMCLITDSKEAMGILINCEGIVIKKSSMLYDEEEETIDYSDNLRELEMDYTVIKNIKKADSCRIETEQKAQIIKKINKLYQCNKYSALKYIYYDLNEEEKDNIDEIHKELINIILKQYKDKSQKINNTINAITLDKIT